jgi:hypothetical protein
MRFAGIELLLPSDLIDVSPKLAAPSALARFLRGDVRRILFASFQTAIEKRESSTALSMQIVTSSQLKENDHETCYHRLIAGRWLSSHEQ